MTHETWRTLMARLGIQYQERDRKVDILIDGRVAATIRPDEYRSGNGGYVFRHAIQYHDGSPLVFADDMNHAASIVAFHYRFTSQQPRPYAGR